MVASKDTHFRFSKERIESLPLPKSGRVIYHDIKVPGLKLRVSNTGVKTFLVYKKIGTSPVKTTLGRFPAMTIDQARQQAIANLSTILSGVNPNKAKRAQRVRGLTLLQVLNDYLELRAHKLAESTRQNYRAMLEKHLADWLAKPLREINRDMVAQRHQKIAGEIPVAANNVMRVLRALFNFANGQYEGDDGKSLFPDNPVKRLSHTRVWRPEQRRQTIIKSNDLPRWFDAIEQLRVARDDAVDNCSGTVADYLEFVLFTGLRRDDALSLRWDQIDLKAKIIHPVIHKKSRTVMSFPLSDYAAKILLRRYAERVNDFIFPGREPFDADGFSKRFDEPKRQIARVVELSGIQFSSHDLRRTFITVAESLDISAFALKRLCSHGTGGDVTAGYVIMDVERLRAPINQIANFLLKAAERAPGADVQSLPVQTKRRGRSQTK